MKIFLETSSILEIKSCLSLGILDGVSIFAKDLNSEFENLIKTTDLPFIIDLFGIEKDLLAQEAKRINKISSNIIIKFSIHQSIFSIANELINQHNISLNLNNCFTVPQAILTAKINTNFISVLIGKIDDSGSFGINTLKDIKFALDQYPEYSTEIIATSLRNIPHIVECAKIGVDAISIPFILYNAIFTSPLGEFYQLKKNKN